MPRMKENLHQYLETNKPDRKTQLTWIRRLADTLAYIHSRCVIVADVRPYNIMLDDDLNVKFIDFSESTLMPLDWDLEGPDHLGCSILTDIGQFGAVMFQIVTGQKCKFDIEAEDEVAWPRRKSLPSTENVWIGRIIEKCWNQGFKSMKDVTVELELEMEND